MCICKKMTAYIKMTSHHSDCPWRMKNILFKAGGGVTSLMLSSAVAGILMPSNGSNPFTDLTHFKVNTRALVLYCWGVCVREETLNRERKTKQEYQDNGGIYDKTHEIIRNICIHCTWGE
jgi:hypothetical protein